MGDRHLPRSAAVVLGGRRRRWNRNQLLKIQPVFTPRVISTPSESGTRQRAGDKIFRADSIVPEVAVSSKPLPAATSDLLLARLFIFNYTQRRKQ